MAMILQRNFKTLHCGLVICLYAEVILFRDIGVVSSHAFGQICKSEFAKFAVEDDR